MASEPVATVAIDFGTTYSGYAYTFTAEYRADPTKISCNVWESAGVTPAPVKTPTKILLNWSEVQSGDDRHAEYGFEAQEGYINMDEEQVAKYVMAELFKMELYEESAKSGLSRNFKVRLPNGERMKAIKLISMFIGYLKNHFLDSIAEKGIPLKITEIGWVLTVPAIWTEGAKQFMKEAAEMAGLPAENITIAFEPEAAALFWLKQPDPTDPSKKPILDKGTSCLVIDAGGGTVDFTVLEVMGSDKMAETGSDEFVEIKQAPSGGPWGGTVVDEKFIGIIRNIVGDEVYETFCLEHRSDLHDLYCEFEREKRKQQYRKKGEAQTMRIKFPVAIGEVYQKKTGKSISSAAEAKYDKMIKISKDKLFMDYDMFKGLFTEPCGNIVRHTKKLMKETKVDKILLVGGFGSAEIVKETLRENFETQVIIPEAPEMSVVRGAVHYGINPFVVTSRIARYTYGTEACKAFDKQKHPEENKRVYDGVEKCIDIFDVHVRKGQIVKIGHPESRKSYSPVSAEQNFMKFEIYASTEESPMLVTDRSCRCIGEFEITLEGRGLKRNVMTEMSFGETELIVRATEQSTGKTESARLNFLDIADRYLPRSRSYKKY